ncbi:Periplasmic binding protein [Rubrobacter radiotolerans]|uniref:Cobalamin-binding protein n=1 Tax=Rubrobacter radiotolerans TaxID=42256 RepID=A0A023WZ39_RUBRA|nr:cobalamin-binding protein [Rubrobacter radiotolerans]AHY45487.1 Periplasmic binding protein [Rubrobacter radiotolerans]MDX5892898.1 cobalamin-binding protein [Rubrobacter radiotolerans]SMC02706.1 iron complex transport system substrate-binding protein [Rubrobacter radiotolerans DSM 5868]
MRVASLLPSATELVAFAGAGGSLVGVTHECDYPEPVRGLPRLTSSKIAAETMTSREIDAAVGGMTDAESLYALDADLLERLRPDLVVTQGLCEVCAVSEGLVARAVSRLPQRPELLSLNPTSIEGVLNDALRVARAVGAERETALKVAALRERLKHAGERIRSVPERPRVACVEWLDPPFSAGHWVPEIVALAGGEDVLARPGETSRRMSWAEVAEAEPEVLVLMPCGFGVERVLREVGGLAEDADYRRVEAVRRGEVWVVDANSYFSRPAPRLVDGVEILARILHPDAFPDPPDRRDALRLALAGRIG